MARDEQHAYLMGAAEALLFVSDEPVSSTRLAEILEVPAAEVDEALALLCAEYMDENRGIQLREVAGGWRFFTHPAHHDIIERYVVSWDTHRMSQAALEALAVIAYHQPVTRASVNAIRGVNSESVVSSLIEKGLVRELGRDKPGGAILYGTTRTFLERFGLKSVKDLPPLEDFAPDEESREQIRERLSGAGKMPDMQLELSEDVDEYAEGGLELAITREDGSVPVEEVDSGDDERVDDAQGVAEVISEAMTERVDFDIFEFDDDYDDEESSGQDDDEEDEDDVIDDTAEDDDLIDYAEDEADAGYSYEDDFDDEDEAEEDDSEGDGDDDGPDEDDDIELVE